MITENVSNTSNTTIYHIIVMFFSWPVVTISRNCFFALTTNKFSTQIMSYLDLLVCSSIAAGFFIHCNISFDVRNRFVGIFQNFSKNCGIDFNFILRFYCYVAKIKFQPLQVITYFKIIRFQCVEISFARFKIKHSCYSSYIFHKSVIAAA